MTAPRFTPEELQAATGGRWTGTPPAEVAGVSTDTRTLAPGTLFVALRGERFDAHDHLAEAAAKGAVAAAVAEGWLADPAHPERRGPAGPAAALPLLAVADTLPALGAIARLHRRLRRLQFVDPGFELGGLAAGALLLCLSLFPGLLQPPAQPLLSPSVLDHFGL